jgi:hypothetical protein
MRNTVPGLKIGVNEKAAGKNPAAAGFKIYKLNAKKMPAWCGKIDAARYRFANPI